MTLLKEIKNGKLYQAGAGEEQIYVVPLWATPFDMGYAHGSLLGGRITKMVATFWKYMESEVVSFHFIDLSLIFYFDRRLF